MYRLRERKDFWNVPCNPITGYRLKFTGGIPKKNIKQLFLKYTNENVLNEKEKRS